jgi:hypothetical protein
MVIRICCFFWVVGGILFFSYKLLTFWLNPNTMGTYSVVWQGWRGGEILQTTFSPYKKSTYFDSTYIHTLFKNHVYVIPFLWQAKNNTSRLVASLWVCYIPCLFFVSQSWETSKSLPT